MKTKAIISAMLILLVPCSVLLTSCSKDIDAPSLPATDNDVMVPGVTLPAETLFGVWEGKTVTQGSTVTNTFEQSYRLDFQSVDDGEAVYSHWYADARTNDRDSICNVEYSYTFDGASVSLKPRGKGFSGMKAVHTGGNQMELYAVQGDVVSRICSLIRTSDPEPVVTSVNRTMPQVGEKVTVTGRNLQFVDHVFLPTATGELEVTDFTKTSKEIQFVLPAGNYAQGSIRCQATGAHVSTFSPAYMFCTDCVFFKTFSSTGGTKPYYVGTEFENTIGITSSLMTNATAIDATAIPAGHSLEGVAVKNPDYFLSFFGKTPIAWTADTSTDVSGSKENYLRFSTADCLQHVLDKCGGLLTAKTKCEDAAIQMDIYVYSNGQPEWNTGYLSWRLNKNNKFNNEMVANVAMWSLGSPVSFADGWLTFTIPLTAFTATRNAGWDTIGGLVSSLKKGKLETIIKIMNYQLDANHPTQDLASFQFNIADIRLVPYHTPANKKE